MSATLLTPLASGGASAGAPGAGKSGAVAIHAVAHIDILPTGLAPATQALSTYLTAAKNDPHVARIDLLRQIGAPNHFTLIETFRDRRAYDAHVTAAYVRAFRAALQPYLGSPYDERRHTAFEPDGFVR